MRVRFLLWGLAALSCLLAGFCLYPLPGVRIAHAGGATPQGVYCNCREAFDRSYARGFRLIETDFSTTTDGKIVLLHDWGPQYQFWFQRSKPLSHSEFTQSRVRVSYHPMDLAALVIWMGDHPKVRVVTDVKGDNLAMLQDLARTPVRERFIPQIYSADQIDPVRALGFKDVIFTNYRAHLPREKLEALLPRVWAVTVWKDEAERMPGRVFAYTVNSPLEANLLRLKGVVGVYTDTLPP
ncbi:MAG: hypothetical protein JWO33_2675 [Caulobacteraceae bacterium]|nr:hypothetical protein [Caulobacteraceae bacterium]